MGCEPTDENTTAASAVLTNTIPLEPGSACPSGGQTIIMGNDANGNGVLDETEVTQEANVCNGESGEEESCQFQEADGGVQVACPGEEPFLVPTGKDGENGVDGEPGEEGEPGEDGADADPCEVERDDAAEVTTIICPDSDPVVIPDGMPGVDASPCSVDRDENAGVTTITCPGTDAVVIRDGQDGQDGQPGDHAQPCTVERDEAAGTTTVTCPGSPAVVIADGQNGQPGDNAQPCTVERDDAAGTTTVTCPGSDPGGH